MRQTKHMPKVKKRSQWVINAQLVYTLLYCTCRQSTISYMYIHITYSDVNLILVLNFGYVVVNRAAILYST